MGREFLELFQDWADSYDDSVTGKDAEYAKVFQYYEHILEAVAERSNGTVVEFGMGTGNLTLKLLEKGLKVIAIEPSKEMRAIGEEKLQGRTKIIDGDFIQFQVEEDIDTIVSTYAFHHLTDEEKLEAFSIYGRLLKNDGKIVFADTMYETKEAYLEAIKKAENDGFLNLAEDLQREYYTTIPVLTDIAQRTGFEVSFNRCNDFVWIMEAIKK
ncbi:class I SAM-dependent methyltransferase [Falsibacillus pallidus]|uniref:class I SAM-dependent methyltransferase n=1 Tax=Falsibacillus pallidus TaxID=493781 RepID=UPI003D9903AB